MAATVTTHEGTHEMGDGLKIYTKTWVPSTAPKAQVLFLHGFSDHVNCYHPFASHLASRGILFHSYDQRGYGRTSPSAASYGDSGPTPQILADINSLLLKLLNASPSLPTFLVGHSNGGAIALVYAFQGTYRARVAGYAVWAPAVAIAPESQSSALVRGVGRVAAAVAPKRQMVHKLDMRFMSRDRAVNKAFADDPLCHDTGTLECLRGILERGDMLRSENVVKRFSPTIRVWVAHGTKDRCCDWRATKEFVDRLEVDDKTFVKYDGWYHKLHAEPGEDKVRFADDLGDWLLARTKAVTGSKL